MSIEELTGDECVCVLNQAEEVGTDLDHLVVPLRELLLPVPIRTFDVLLEVVGVDGVDDLQRDELSTTYVEQEVPADIL